MSTYYLKYFAEIMDIRGHLSRVEIHQRDTQPALVLEIGDVCGLELEIQGGQDDVFAPIIKTQARLSMISCDDKPTEGGVKYGGWQEFYTPDSTLYKMVIKTKPTATSSSWTTRWSGYITPDSWQEGLEYRGAITITARDNIGHLQDFEFDMAAADQYGLASIRNILAAAMAKIDLPMSYVDNSAPHEIQGDSTDVLDAMIVVSNFYGRDWFSVTEDLLDSIGYAMRWTDNNRVTVAPVRYLPFCGGSSATASGSIQVLDFYGGLGEQIPAAKSITEVHDYDYNGDVLIPITGGLVYGATSTYRCKVAGNTLPGGGTVSRVEHDAAYNDLTGAGSTAWHAGSDMLNPALYQATGSLVREEGSRWDQYAFLAANGTDQSLREQVLSFYCGTPDVTLKFSFAKFPVGLNTSGGSTKVYREWMSLYKISYSVSYTKGGLTKYWDGRAWGSTSTVIDKEFDSQYQYETDLEIALAPCDAIPDGGIMQVEFHGIWYKMWSEAYDGVYARLASLTVTVNITNLSKNTVRTINDEQYNVLIKRTPAIAPLSRVVPVALPENYPTALFFYPTGGSYPVAYPYLVNWDDIDGVTKPLPVLVHQQILCYRGASLWQLTGECAPHDGTLLFMDKPVSYKGRICIVQSGTFDFRTGHLGGVVLREYLDYDNIWDDTEQGTWEDVAGYPGSGAASTSSSSGASLAPSGGSSYFEEDGNGGIKVKDEYKGLSTKGFLISGGIGEEGEDEFVTFDEVWDSLTNNTDKPNTKIHQAHIPWTNMPAASTDTIGGVKVDAITITIAEGIIALAATLKTKIDNAIAGAALDGLTVPKKIIVCEDYPSTLEEDALYFKVKPQNNNNVS